MSNASFDEIAQRLANCVRYNEAMNEHRLPPNGDDYNALLEMLAGYPYRTPHVDGR
jgi:hypothetical protein